MPNEKQKQIEIAERLQTKLLERFEKLIDSGAMTATDAAVLTRLLMANGWSIDPTKVPTGLRGVLTDAVNALDVDEDEIGIN